MRGKKERHGGVEKSGIITWELKIPLKTLELRGKLQRFFCKKFPERNIIPPLIYCYNTVLTVYSNYKNKQMTTYQIRSQWRMYPNLIKMNGAITLGAPSKIKSFFCATSVRSFKIEPFRLSYYEKKNCLDRNRPEHLTSSLLVSTEDDYFIDDEKKTITVRPHRGRGWSLVLKFDQNEDTVLFEEFQEKLNETARLDPLRDVVARDFSLGWSDDVKQELFDQIVQLRKHCPRPALATFYMETMLHVSNDQQQVVAILYDNFYRAFAEGRSRGQRIISAAAAPSDDQQESKFNADLDILQELEEDQLHKEMMEQEFIMSLSQLEKIQEENLNYDQAEEILRGQFDQAKRQKNQAYLERKASKLSRFGAGFRAGERSVSELLAKHKNSQTTKDSTNRCEVAIDDKTKARDAVSFARLLAAAAKNPCVRAFFLYFQFSEFFVDEFNEKKGRHFSHQKVLEVILNKIEKKSNGVWGKRVQPTFLRLMNFPTEITKRASRYQPQPPQVPRNMEKQRHRSPKQRSLRTFTRGEEKFESADQADDASETSNSTISDDSASSGDTEPSVPMARAREDPNEFLLVFELGMATNTEAEWCKRMTKDQRQRGIEDISYVVMNDMLDNSGREVARHFLYATKGGRMRDKLEIIPDIVAANAFKVGKHLKCEDAREASPLIAVLVHKYAQHKDDTLAVCECILRSTLLTDNFFRMFLRAALSSLECNSCRLIKRFMDHCFFPEGKDYNSNPAAFPRHLSSILLEEIWTAIKNDHMSIHNGKINVLIEYSLRFESMPKDMTLQQWIESDRRGDNGEIFVNMIRDNPNFAKHFSDICCPNALLISRHRTSQSLQGLPVNVLSELNGDYKQRRRQHLVDALFGFIARQF